MAAPPSAEGHVGQAGTRRLRLGWAQDARRAGRGAGPGDPVHQLPHLEGWRAAQVGAGAGRGARAGSGPATRAPARSVCREDLWVRGGRILDPEKLFFEERRVADEQRDCGGCILAPGFIDVQINGGFGVDFSQASEDVGSGVALVARRILSHGVTSFCPTLVTSPLEVYHKVLPQIPVKSGGPHGAGVLGVHLEGPFISREKRGAHPEAHLRSFEADAFQDVLATYGGLDNVRIVTLAPELGHSQEVIRALTALGICVSLGIVGLLTSDRLPAGRHIFYGMIADGIHTNPAALRIAHRAHPKGLVLVTDAVPALGLGNGRHTLGQQEVEVDGLTAYVAGTNTLSGSIAPMDTCVRHFLQATGCSVESALEAASLHPAQLLGLEKRKGTLDFGADADFVVLDDSLHVRATYISGELVWQVEEARP